MSYKGLQFWGFWPIT